MCRQNRFWQKRFNGLFPGRRRTRRRTVRRTRSSRPTTTRCPSRASSLRDLKWSAGPSQPRTLNTSSPESRLTQTRSRSWTPTPARKPITIRRSTSFRRRCQPDRNRSRRRHRQVRGKCWRRTSPRRPARPQRSLARAGCSRSGLHRLRPHRGPHRWLPTPPARCGRRTPSCSVLRYSSVATFTRAPTKAITKMRVAVKRFDIAECEREKWKLK